MAALLPAPFIAKQLQATTFFDGLNTDQQIIDGPFKANWDSLAYQAPDWYRNAKFGIWAHWGPQCQPALATGMQGKCTWRETINTSTILKNPGTPPFLVLRM